MSVDNAENAVVLVLGVLFFAGMLVPAWLHSRRQRRDQDKGPAQR